MKNKSKKCVSAALVGIMLFSLTACGGKEEVKTPTPSTNVQVEETTKVEQPEINDSVENLPTDKVETPDSEEKEEIKEEINVEESTPMLSGIDKEIAEKDYLGLDVNKHQFLPLHCSEFKGDGKLISYITENRKVEILEALTYEDDNFKVTPVRIELDSDGEHIVLNFENKTDDYISVMLYEDEFVKLNGIEVEGYMTDGVAGKTTKEMDITISKVDLLINNIEKIKTANFTVTAVNNNSDDTFIDLHLSTDATDYEQVLITEKNDIQVIYENNGIRVGILTEYLEVIESDVFNRVYVFENKSEDVGKIRVESADEKVFKSGISMVLNPGEVGSFVDAWDLVGEYPSARATGLKSDTKAFQMDGMFEIEGTEQVAEVSTTFYEGFDK